MPRYLCRHNIDHGSVEREKKSSLRAKGSTGVRRRVVVHVRLLARRPVSIHLPSMRTIYRSLSFMKMSLEKLTKAGAGIACPAVPFALTRVREEGENNRGRQRSSTGQARRGSATRRASVSGRSTRDSRSYTAGSGTPGRYVTGVRHKTHTHTRTDARGTHAHRGHLHTRRHRY